MHGALGRAFSSGCGRRHCPGPTHSGCSLPLDRCLLLSLAREWQPLSGLAASGSVACQSPSGICSCRLTFNLPLPRDSVPGSQTAGWVREGRSHGCGAMARRAEAAPGTPSYLLPLGRPSYSGNLIPVPEFPLSIALASGSLIPFHSLGAALSRTCL